ncbi:MAG: hypothetical protein ACP6IS_06955 [Candidatus Asgardarchaeia archaeon]
MADVRVICPTCKKTGTIDVPDYIFENIPEGGLIKVSVLPGNICSHGFIVYVDKNKIARRYSAVDYVLAKPGESAEVKVEEVGVTREILEKLSPYIFLKSYFHVLAGMPVILVDDPESTLERKLERLYSTIFPKEIDVQNLIAKVNIRTLRSHRIKMNRNLVVDVKNKIILYDHLKDFEMGDFQKWFMTMYNNYGEDDFLRSLRDETHKFVLAQKIIFDIIKREKRIPIRELADRVKESILNSEYPITDWEVALAIALFVLSHERLGTRIIVE